MKTQYNYLSSTDYIESLKFHYVETYSFQRGIDFEENLKKIRNEYERLTAKKKRQTNLTQNEEMRLSELYGLLGINQYLINDQGQFHPSSKKMNKFNFNDPKVTRLSEILNTKIQNLPQYMCVPIYRDAVVFYDKNDKVISTLNVCLSCEYMQPKMHSYINADQQTYALLRSFFIDIGHNVENQ